MAEKKEEHENIKREIAEKEGEIKGLKIRIS
jgi:hypothetical protein